MNTAFLILWLLLAFLLVILIYQGIRNINNAKNDKQVYVIDFNQNLCFPNGDSNALPPVPTTCCVTNGTISANRPYISPVNPNLGFILNSNPVNFEQVCYDYCQNINIKTGKCDDDSSSLYSQCLNLLAPVNGCYDSAMPLAQLNGIPYYAQEPYLAGENCINQETC